MFGLSKRRVKLGRFKLSDSPQANRSPMRNANHINNINGKVSISGEAKNQYSSEAVEEKSGSSGNSDNWITLSISGDKPIPCFNHAATVIGSKMIVVGGESGNALLEDVQVLDFDKFSWTKASSKLFISPSNLPLKIPASVGHSLVSWGEKAVMVGGKTQPYNERVSVWVFDVEGNGWSLMEAKGDIPIGRIGHSVVRAGSVLILFGGEDLKKKKLNDLYMFDLKSLTWLPLYCTGSGPSPRSNHVAAIYDDRVLLIFGGTSKSKTFNDLYSLDFEAMMWSRIKIRGFCPSPRSGCSGVLCGSKWYIAGGGCRNKRCEETLIFDVLKVEWNIAVVSPPSSLTTGKGFSLVLVRDNEKDFLVAFGGCKKDCSNEVEIFQVEKKGLSVPEEAVSMPSENNTSKEPDSYPHILGQHRLFDLVVARKNMVSDIIKHGSGRRSLSDSFHVPQNIVVGDPSAQKPPPCDEEQQCAPTMMKKIDGQFNSLMLSRIVESGGDLNLSAEDPKARINNPDEFRTQSLGHMNLGFGGEAAAARCIENDIYSSCTSTIYEFCESRVASLIRDNGMLEGKLAATVASREAMEKNLSSALGSRQEVDKKLADNLKETEFLKEKLAAVETAREETNNLYSIVHSDNIRLEHDVAFLKAVLEDTQKELHSTRGVLAGERARAFQLQVEVFHLKQRMQTLETRTPTPRKPFPL